MIFTFLDYTIRSLIVLYNLQRSVAEHFQIFKLYFFFFLFYIDTSVINTSLKMGNFNAN